MNCWYDLDEYRDWCHPCYSSCYQNSLFSFEWEQCRPLGRARSSLCMVGPSSWYGCFGRTVQSRSNCRGKSMNRCSTCCCSPCRCPSPCCNMWSGSTCCRRLAPIRPRTPKSKKVEDSSPKKSARVIRVIKPPKRVTSGRFACLCDGTSPDGMDIECLCNDSTPQDSRSTVRASSGISQIRSASAENHALLPARNHQGAQESSSGVREATPTMSQMRSVSADNYAAFSALCPAKVDNPLMHRMEGHMMDSQPLANKMISQDPCCSGHQGQEHMINPIGMNSHGTSTQTESGFIPIPIKTLSGNVPPQMMGPRMIPMMSMMPGAAAGMPMGFPFMCLPSAGGWPLPMACNCIMGRQGPVPTSPIPGPFPGANFGLTPMGFQHSAMMGGMQATGVNWMTGSRGSLSPINDFAKPEKPPQEIEELYQYAGRGESGSSGAGTLTSAGRRGGHGGRGRRGGSVRRSTAPGTRLRPPGCRSSCTGIRSPGGGPCMHSSKRSGRARGTRQMCEGEYRATSGTASSVGSARQSGSRVDRSHVSSKNRGDLNMSVEPLQFKEPDSAETMSGVPSGSPSPPLSPLPHAIALPGGMMGIGMGPGSINPCWRPVPSMPCCIVHDSIAKRIFESLVHETHDPNAAMMGSAPRSASADRVQGHWMHRQESPASLLMGRHHSPMRQKSSHRSHHGRRSRKSLNAEDFPHRDVDFPVSQKTTCCLFNAATQTFANTYKQRSMSSGKRRNYARSRSSSASREIAHPRPRVVDYSEGRSLSETLNRKTKFSAGRSKRSASHGSKNHPRVREGRSRSSSCGRKFNYHQSRSRSSSKERKPQKKQVSSAHNRGFNSLERTSKQDDNRGSQPPPASASVGGVGGSGGAGGRDAEGALRGSSKKSGHSRQVESADDMRSRLSRRAYRSITKTKKTPRQSPGRIKSAVYQMDQVTKEAPCSHQGDQVVSPDSSKSHENKQENKVSDEIMQAFQNVSNQADHDCARKPVASCLHRNPESPSVYKCAPISTSPTTSASETVIVPHFNTIPPQQKISVGYKYTTKNETDAPETLGNTSITYVKQCTSPKQESSDLLLTGPNEMVLQYDLTEFAKSNPMFGNNALGNLPGSRPFIVSPPHKISVEYRCSGTPHKRAITYVPENPQLKKISTDDMTISIDDKTQIPSLPSMDQPRRRTKEERQQDKVRGESSRARERSKLRGKSSSEEIVPRKSSCPPKEQKERNEMIVEKIRSRSHTSSKGKDSRSESKTSAVAGESFRSAVGDLSSSQRSYPSQTANPIQTSPATSEPPQQPPTQSPVISQTDAPEESGMTTELTSNQTAGTSSPSPLKSPSASHRRTLLSFRRRSACKQGRNLSISPLANLSPKSQRQKNANGKQKKTTSPPSNQVNPMASNLPASRRTLPRATSFESSGHQHTTPPTNQQQASKKHGGGTQTMAEQHCKGNQLPLNRDPQTSQTTDPSQGNAENQPTILQVGTENPSGVKKLSGKKESPDGRSKDVSHQRSKRRHHHKREHSDIKGTQPPQKLEPQQSQLSQQQQMENQNQQLDNQKLPEVQPPQVFPQPLPVQGFPQVQLFQLTSLLSQHAFQPPLSQNQNFTPMQTHPPLQQPQTELQQPPQLTQQQSQAQLLNQMFQHTQIHPLPQPQPEPQTYRPSSTQLQTQLYQQQPIFQAPQTHQHPPMLQQSQLFQQSEIFQQQTQPQRIPQQGFPPPSGFPPPQNSLFQLNQQVNLPITKEKSSNLEVPLTDASRAQQNRSRSASKMRPPQPVSLPELSESKGRTRSESRGPVSDLTLDGSRHGGTRSRSVVNGKFDGTNNQVGSRSNTPSENRDYQSSKDIGRPSSQTQQLSKLQRAVQYAATIPRPILKPQRRKRKMGATVSSQATNQLKPLDQTGEMVSQSETLQVSQPANEGVPTTCLHQNPSPVSSTSPGMTPLTSSQNLPNFFPFPASSTTVSQTPSSLKFSPTPSRQFSSGYASQTNFHSGHMRHKSQADVRFTPNFQFSQICPQSGQLQQTQEFSPTGIPTSTLFAPSTSGKASHNQIDITLSVPNSHPEHAILGKHHSEAQLPSSLLSDKHQYGHQSENSRNILQTFSKMESKKSEAKLEFAFSLGGKSSNPPHNLHRHVSPAVLHTSQQPPFSTPLQCSSKSSITVGIGKKDYRDDKTEMNPQRKAEFTPIFFQSLQSRSRENNENKRENSFTNKFLNSGFPKCIHPPFAKSSHPLFAMGHPGPINQLRIGMRRQPTLDRISSVSTTAGNTPDDAKTANDVSEGEFVMKEEGSVSKEQPDREEEAPTKTDSEIFGPNENACLEGESSGNDIFSPDQKRHLVTRSSRLYGGKPSSPEEEPPWSPRNRRPVESRLPIPRRYLGSSSLASNDEGATCRSGTEQTEDEYHVSLREKATSVRFGSSSTQVSRSSPQTSRVQPSATTGQSPPPSNHSNSPAPTRRPGPTSVSSLVVARRQKMAQQRALSVSVTSVDGEGDDHPKRRMRTETGKKLDALQRSQIARQSPSKTRPPNYHPVLQQSATEDRFQRKQPTSPTRGLSPAIPSEPHKSRFPRPEAAPQKTKHAPGGIQSVRPPDDVATPPTPRVPRTIGRGQHQLAQHQQPQPPPTGVRGEPKRPPLSRPVSPQENNRIKGRTGRESETPDDSVTPPTRCKDAAPLRKIDSRAVQDSRTNRVTKEHFTKEKEVEVKEKDSSVSEMPEESVVTIVENPEETKNKSNERTSGNTGTKESEESKKSLFPPTGFAAMRKSIKNCLALVTAPGMDGDCNKGSKDIIVMHEETSMSSPFQNSSSIHNIYDKLECPENDKPPSATKKRSSPVLWRKNDFDSAVTNLKKSNSTFIHSSSFYNCAKDPVPTSKSLLDDVVSDSKVLKPSETGVASSEVLSKKPSLRCAHGTPPKVGPEGYPLVNSSRAYLEQQFQLLQRNQFYQQQILEQQHQVLQQFQSRPVQETSGPGNEKLKESLPEDHTLQAVTSLDDDEEEVESPPPPRRDEASNPGLAKTIRATRALRQAVKDMQLIQGRRDSEGSRYSLIPRGAQTKLIEQTRKSGDILHHEANYTATLPQVGGGGSPCCRCVSRTVFSWRNSQSQPHVQHCSSHHMPQHNLGCSSWHGAAWWANAKLPSPQSSCSITQKSTSSTIPRIQSSVSHGRFCHPGSHLRSKSVHPTITEPSLPSASNRNDRWQVRWRQYSPEVRVPRHFCSCSAVHRQHDRHKETHNTAGDAGFGSWSRHLLSPCVQAVPVSLQPRVPQKTPVSSAPATRPHRSLLPHPPPLRARSVTAHEVTNTFALASKPSAKRLKLSESKNKVRYPFSTMLRLKLSESKIGSFGPLPAMRAFETNVEGKLTTCGSHNWRRLSRKDRILLLQRFHRLERSSQLRQINALHGSRHKFDVPEVLDNTRFRPDDTVELRIDEYQRLMAMADEMTRLEDKRLGCRLSATQLNTYFNTRPKPRTPPPTPASPKMVANNQSFEILQEGPSKEDIDRRKGTLSEKSSRERKRAKKAKKKKKRTKSAATVTRSVCSKATSRSSYKRSRERAFFFNADGGGSPSRNSASPGSAKSRRGARRRQRSNPDKSPKR